VKVLDRWILKRFLLAYAAFASVVLVMFVMTDGFNHLDQFYATAIKTQRPLWRIALAHYSAIVPDIYYMLAPFLALLAAMWVVFELRRNNEFVPLQAAGIAPWRITLPLFVAALGLAGVMYADRELVIPEFAQQFREITNLKREHVSVNPIPDQRNGVLSARNYSPPRQELVEARYTLLDPVTHGEVLSVVASSASCVEKGWIFHDGIVIERSGGLDIFRTFGERPGHLVETDVRIIDVECAAVDMLGYLTTRQLIDQYKRIPAFRQLRVEVWRRTAYPCASIVLLFIGLPFVLRGDKGAAAIGLIVCIGVCALFFLLTAFFEDLGSRPGGLVPPPLAAWLANLVFLGPGLLAFSRSTR
jgi:lipopolysaccharide export system permease protein